MKGILVLTTTDTPELAERIATALVEHGEAGCVSILNGIHSVYRWKGKICNDSETLLLIKSTRDAFQNVGARIRLLHSYEVPEIIALSFSDGDPTYLDWLVGQVAPDSA